MKYENNVVRGKILSELAEEPIVELETLSHKAAAEGSVLVENKNNVLPLKDGETVSIFGRIQNHYYKSGTGSGGLVNVKYVTDILSSFRKCKKVKVNETLAKIYEDWTKIHPYDNGDGWSTCPLSQVEMPIDEKTVLDARKVSDTAIVIIGRSSGEDRDTAPNEGAYLLSNGEEQLLSEVSKHFERIVVVLNVGNIIDMNFVDKYNVSSVLYVWQGGMCGGDAAVDVMVGNITPSGKLPDTIPTTLKDLPANDNFYEDYRVEYAEDIYIGYRYFETFKKENVKYPFGFGLSYTEFDRNFVVVANGLDIKVKATVKNIGKYSAKDTVEVYVEAPNGKLGKPIRVLADFEKTKTLSPNEEETIELNFNLSRVASYDDSGKTGNKSCYVLEEGKYNIAVGTDVRSAKNNYTLELPKLVITEKCTEALSPVESFKRMVNVNGNLQFEEAPKRTYSIEKRIKDNLPKSTEKTENKGIKLKDVKSGKNTLSEFLAQFENEDLACLVRGEGMNSPKVTAGTGSCLGGLTEELIDFGLPIACTTDGPSGIRMDSGALATAMPNGVCLASTFDKKLIRELFVYEGIELTAYKIDIILGPGINIHRTPLNGRNFEYFSEDPFLTGIIASEISKGLSESGVSCAIKHYACNNREFNRNEYDVIISERALREIYLKSFEIAVKEGKPKSIMTSYNKINGNHSSSNYDLNTTILRGEWNFDGFVMTDWWAKMTTADGSDSKQDLASMIKAQNDIYMVVNSSKDHKDNIIESLKNGYLTRGELERCASNLVRYLMNTHAYERFANSGYTYEPINEDFASKNVFLTIDKIGKYGFELNVERAGKYYLEIDYKTDSSDLVQIPIKVLFGTYAAASILARGTNKEERKVYASLSMVKGKNQCFIDVPKGFDIKKIVIYN